MKILRWLLVVTVCFLVLFLNSDSFASEPQSVPIVKPILSVSPDTLAVDHPDYDTEAIDKLGYENRIVVHGENAILVRIHEIVYLSYKTGEIHWKLSLTKFMGNDGNWSLKSIGGTYQSKPINNIFSFALKGYYTKPLGKPENRMMQKLLLFKVDLSTGKLLFNDVIKITRGSNVVTPYFYGENLFIGHISGKTNKKTVKGKRKPFKYHLCSLEMWSIQTLSKIWTTNIELPANSKELYLPIIKPFVSNGLAGMIFLHRESRSFSYETIIGVSNKRTLLLCDLKSGKKLFSESYYRGNEGNEEFEILDEKFYFWGNLIFAIDQTASESPKVTLLHKGAGGPRKLIFHNNLIYIFELNYVHPDPKDDETPVRPKAIVYVIDKATSSFSKLGEKTFDVDWFTSCDYCNMPLIWRGGVEGDSLVIFLHQRCSEVLPLTFDLKNNQFSQLSYATLSEEEKLKYKSVLEKWNSTACRFSRFYHAEPTFQSGIWKGEKKGTESEQDKLQGLMLQDNSGCIGFDADESILKLANGKTLEIGKETFNSKGDVWLDEKNRLVIFHTGKGKATITGIDYKTGEIRYTAKLDQVNLDYQMLSDDTIITTTFKETTILDAATGHVIGQASLLVTDSPGKVIVGDLFLNYYHHDGLTVYDLNMLPKANNVKKFINKIVK